MVFDREVGTLDFQVQRVVRANWCAAEDMSYEKLILFVGAIVTLAAFVRPSSAGLGGGAGVGDFSSMTRVEASAQARIERLLSARLV